MKALGKPDPEEMIIRRYIALSIKHERQPSAEIQGRQILRIMSVNPCLMRLSGLVIVRKLFPCFPMKNPPFVV